MSCDIKPVPIIAQRVVCTAPVPSSGPRLSVELLVKYPNRPVERR